MGRPNKACRVFGCEPIIFLSFNLFNQVGYKAIAIPGSNGFVVLIQNANENPFEGIRF